MDSPASHTALLTEGDAAAQNSPAITLKHDDTFAVFSQGGDLLGAAQGLYHRDTRHLSFLCLRLNGTAPQLLSAALQADNSALTCDLTNPALSDVGNGHPLARGQLHLRRTRFLWNGTCHERIAIRSFAAQPCHLRLEFHFAADFADLFEVRGRRRVAHGEHHRAAFSHDSVALSYTGLDAVRRQTSLCFDPPPRILEAQRAVHDVMLAPGGRTTLFFAIRCGDGEALPPRRGFGAALRQARAAAHAQRAYATRVESNDPAFDAVLRRSAADLGMLVTATPEGPYPYAGTPWYSTAFGRDALITAWQTLWAAPELAKGVLRFLAAHQAKELNPENDAEPGKILHETRQGEMARLGEIPFRHYYGSVDSTPLFIMLAGAYLARTGDTGTLRALWPNIEAALGWIETYGDSDGDGFVEYLRKTPNGLVNQGWKDSQDSVFHAEGTLAQGPIALVELQAYVHAAWRAAAGVARALGEAGRAATLEMRAEALRLRFEARFWDEELGTYVLALDGEKRPCRILSSNAGHTLFGGIARADRASRLARRLLEPDHFCGWGIRTLASGQARFNPMSYHNGSVWPHDNALIAEGLARYGHREAAMRVFTALLDAAAHDPAQRLPELYCGFPRRRGEGPTLYPVACSPQAWAAGTPVALLGVCLGLRFDPPGRRIVLENPMLPPGVEHLSLHNLRLAEDHVDLALWREDGTVRMRVLHQTGGLQASLRVSSTS